MSEHAPRSAATVRPVLDLVVLDCPDPRRLGDFYGALLGFEVVDADDDWVTVRPGEGATGLAFQRVEGYAAPSWPGQERPQQFHLDLDVPDIDAVEPDVLELGARVAEVQPSEAGSFRVYLDPAGHPFCLCRAD
ncbi:MAG TPA: VOC family protein [Dermatophilaceae bacterium]|nr:VOC family protein [Dermatophilaceae bacterium]